MAKTTGMNTDESSEFGHLLAGDFLLNASGKSEWRDTYPTIDRLRSEARRLGSSRIFDDLKTVAMV